MKFSLHILFIGLAIYQSLGLLPSIDVSVSSEHKNLRDSFAVQESSSPFILMRIPNKSENFLKLQLAMSNHESIEMNGVAYDLVSLRIFSDFLELRVVIDEADLLAKAIEKEKNQEANENGLQSSVSCFLFLSMMTPPAQFTFAPAIPVMLSENVAFAYASNSVNAGFYCIIAPPPRA